MNEISSFTLISVFEDFINHGFITTVVSKRTVKAKKAKPEVEVVQLDEDSVQVCTLYSI